MLISKSTLSSKTPDHRETENSRIPSLHGVKVVTIVDESSQVLSTELTEQGTMYRRRKNFVANLWLVSVFLAFAIGLTIGVLLTETSVELPKTVIKINKSHTTRTLNSVNDNHTQNLVNDNKFHKVTFTGSPSRDVQNREIYPKSMTEDMKAILKDNKAERQPIKIAIEDKTIVPNDETVLYKNIFWGPQVEKALPQGYDKSATQNWEEYLKNAEVVKMEAGCGRMQNRLVTFKDGLRACVRYRQNTDQIQGEIFSFYVARLLNLTNLAPSAISVVDMKSKLWSGVSSDIARAQWSQNRAVVLTQYIQNLESASIPQVFKPSERHLNKLDVLKIVTKDGQNKNTLLDKLKKYNSDKVQNTTDFDHIDAKLGDKVISNFIELAQWSDLIIFDYLIANLDRIVNNLFNFQWNVNIMDGPAHNLAKKVDSGLLMFLDNESGLLHGYRLLKKYNVYHSLMLDNLCVFRKSTVDALNKLYTNMSIGSKISQMFREKNNIVIRDILPPLPDKNIKILYERIGKVLNQVQKCEQSFSKR